MPRSALGTGMSAPPPPPPLRSYGRIRARPLSPRQSALMQDLLPRIAAPACPVAGSLDPASLFGAPQEVWLEIGFGAGEHLVAQARENPAVGFVGVEPFQDGVAKALGQIAENGLANVRLLFGDARPFVAGLRAQSLARIFVLFPDPWPKARHVKRRLLQPAMLEELTRALKPGGRLRIATDWADYADMIAAGLSRTAHLAPDTTAPDDHVPTRYQAKALGDISPAFFNWRRVD